MKSPDFVHIAIAGNIGKLLFILKILVFKEKMQGGF